MGVDSPFLQMDLTPTPALALPERAIQPAHDVPGGWRGVLLRMGQWRAVLFFTVTSIVLSMAITLIASLALDATGPRMVDIAIALIVPLLVAPIVSHAAMGLLAEVEAARQALHEVAMRDSLTQLYNRRFFSARLDSEVRWAQRENVTLALLMIDIDNFKRINDSHGHATGDLVLERVATVLLGGLRPYDLTARYGGEEFVTMLPGVTPLEADAAAERLRQAISDLQIPALSDGPLPQVTASLGISYLDATPDNAARLLARADEAMYLAKTAGRNRCVRLDPPAAA